MNKLGVSLCVLVAATSWAQTPPAPQKVRLVAATPVQSNATETVTGQLGPSRMLPLGFEVGGRLATSKVSRGDLVKAGQPLGSLDTEIIDSQVAQAEAALAAAEAGLAAAEAGLQVAEAGQALAKDMAERNEKLRSEGGISDVMSKQTDAQARTALAQVAQAKAGLAQAGAGLAQAKAGLAQVRAAQRRHHLKALFPGTVIDAPDNVGGILGPGTPVYVIMQLDPLILKATASEKFRAQVVAGQKVHVESVGGDAVTDDAIIKVVLPSADPQTRRVPVEVLVPNSDGRFVGNTLAKLTMSVGGERSAVIIPPTALGMVGGAHVYVVDGTGRLKRVKVSVVERTSTQVTVVPEMPVTQVVDYASSIVEGAAVTQR